MSLKTGTRIASWSAIAFVTLLLASVGIYVASHADSAIDNATLLSGPHEMQTALEHIGATLNSLDDSMQTHIIEGTDVTRIRFQYEEEARSLRAQAAELWALSSTGISGHDLGEVDHAVADALTAIVAVIDTGGAERPDTVRRLAAEGRAVNAASRKLDALIDDQQELIRQRERALRSDVGQMYGGLIGTALIVLCVLVGGVFMVENDRRRGIAVQDFLRSENERLEEAVRERSATLAQANQELIQFAKRAIQIQERERRSLALELHDQIGQELASLVLSLTRYEREIGTARQAEARTMVQESIEIARTAYGEVHNLALDLRPAMLDRFGLIPTLQWYARQQAKHSGCQVTLEADAFPEVLPSDLSTAAFRIVQEAVSNAVRHARPTRIQIQARYRRDCIELHISDDGSGFDLAAANQGQESRIGLGLIGMRQRAQDVGGNVSIRSEVAAGTQIVALLPLPEAA
jgi:signal transduction histidine kinase